MKFEIKDRAYKLLGRSTPLTFIIPSRHSKRNPLLYFDKQTGYNKPLRYARNQKSPFEDEQDGNAIVEPIIFRDGMLFVSETNPVLQQFLYYHPMNGIRFTEIDTEKDAQVQLDAMTVEVDALIEAKSLSVEQLETVARAVFSKDPSTMTTAELRRDILVFAKRNPQVFLRTISDPSLQLIATVNKFFEQKLLAYRNNKKDVHLNLSDNKKRIAVVPFGADPIEFLCEWFKKDENIEVLEFLERQLD